MDSGVVIVESGITEAELRQYGPDATWYDFEVGDDQTKSGFFECVRRSLPQDPPLGDYRDMWEALADSVWGGLGRAHPEGGEAVVYWRDAYCMRTAERGTFDVAVLSFEEVSESLGARRYNPAPLQLLVLLGDCSAKAR